MFWPFVSLWYFGFFIRLDPPITKGNPMSKDPPFSSMANCRPFSLPPILTWIPAVVSKQMTAPWPSRDSTTLVNLSLEPSDESAGQGGCCFLLLLTLLGIFGSSGMSSRNLLSSNFNFPVLTLLMSLRYFGDEVYNRGPNTVIAFFEGIVLGFCLLDTE